MANSFVQGASLLGWLVLIGFPCLLIAVCASYLWKPKRSKGGGKIDVTFRPNDPQKGSVAMRRTITAQDWELIKQILGSKGTTP
jgi:hypothetical protein